MVLLTWLDKINPVLFWSVVLVGPWIAALWLRPLPHHANFPAPREIFALLLTLLFIPPISYVTAQADFTLIVVAPVLSVSLCVFLVAIAGRHPFLYTLIVSLLHLTGLLTWQSILTRQPWRLSQPEEILYLLTCLGAASVFALVARMFLFVVWGAKEDAQAAQAAR